MVGNGFCCCANKAEKPAQINESLDKIYVNSSGRLASPTFDVNSKTATASALKFAAIESRSLRGSLTSSPLFDQARPSVVVVMQSLASVAISSNAVGTYPFKLLNSSYCDDALKVL